VRSLFALLLATVTLGCATSLSSFQPAHVAKKGSVTAEAGMDLSLPTGTVSRAIDAGRALAHAAETRKLTEEEQLTLFGAGTNLALNPPNLVEHAGLTYTPATDWEVGVRYAAASWRVGVRHQVRHQEDSGFDMTIGVGAQRFSFEFPVNDIIDVLKIDDFVRWNFDVPIVFGKHNDYYRVWGGPRFVVSRFDTQLVLKLPKTGEEIPVPQLASARGTGLYIGAQGGAAVGYKKVFLAFELTVVRLDGTAHLIALGRGLDVDMSTWVLYPGLALLGEF
jgi:hypothetical protein